MEHAPRQGGPGEGRVVALRVRLQWVDDPLGRGIEDDEVRYRSGGDGSALVGETQDPGRSGREPRERVAKRKETGLDQVRDRERKRGLETDQPGRCVGELLILL